jgi:hypothetical protein
MIDKCKEKFKKDIFPIVTDNENKMKKMKQSLQKKKNPDLVDYIYSVLCEFDKKRSNSKNGNETYY